MSGNTSRALVQRLRSDDKGGIAIMTALMMPVLVGGMALGAETGALYMQQRKLQHAADMSAFAGAVRLMQGDTKAELTPAARHIADSSGYTGTDAGFVINIPPTTGGFAGDPEAVEVILSEQKPRYLTALFGETAFTLGGRAVARYTWDPGSGSQGCILALSTTAQTAVKALGNSATNAGSCDIASNSNASNSVNIDNVTASCVYTVGEGSASNSTIACGGVQSVARAVRDPYENRSLPPMDDANCTITGNKTYPPNSYSGPWPYQYTHPAGCTYSVFTGNVTFQKNIKLAAGYYVFKNGFTVDPNASWPTNVDGTAGVTMIFIGDANNDLSTAGNATWNIVAPTTGPTAGIAIWIPSTSPITSANFNASGTSTFTGAIYAPSVSLTMNGGSSNTALPGGGCTQIIAGTVNITGGGTYNATGAGCAGTGTEPVKTGETVALAE